ncbi:hypothetical protein SteCoe_1338 [Stentor coeruleus]|uniref:Uncharacterized protein n=1 Tax=Stentor coeruleus TaxID=5963 RepID=A0A1R2D214_9CILI|nr:hypothetical protein SteCoe_1338 [Stentor coeruleus]
MSSALTYGKKSVFKRNVFQAGCAKADTKTEATSLFQQLKNSDSKCIWVAIVYKVQSFEETYEEEEGASIKLLGLLNRMNVKDFVIGIRLWPDMTIAQHDTYRMMLGCAKDLIIDFFTPVTVEERSVLRSRKPNIIEIETLPPETNRNLSFDSFIRQQPSKLVLNTAKQKLMSIVSRINEGEIKALYEFINHNTIGKVLLIILVLLQKQKPTLSLAKQFFMQNHIKDIIAKTDPDQISKIQIQRAKKMMQKISFLKPSNLEKISKSSGLLFQYIQCVLDIHGNQESILPSVQKNLLGNKGEYLKSKHMVFTKENEIIPEAIPEKKEPEIIPEPDGLEKLKNVSTKAHKNAAELYSEVKINEEFKDERFRNARVQRLEEEALISRLINLNPDEVDPDVKIDFDLTEDEVIKFLGSEELDSQPTDLLLKLADRLKDRRERHNLVQSVR